jgi:hypothetical protein
MTSKNLETPRSGFEPNIIDLPHCRTSRHHCFHISMYAIHSYMAEAVRRRVRVGFTDVLVALRQTLKHVTGAYALPTEAEIAKTVVLFLRITFGCCSMFQLFQARNLSKRCVKIQFLPHRKHFASSSYLL